MGAGNVPPAGGLPGTCRPELQSPIRRNLWVWGRVAEPALRHPGPHALPHPEVCAAPGRAVGLLPEWFLRGVAAPSPAPPSAQAAPKLAASLRASGSQGRLGRQ